MNKGKTKSCDNCNSAFECGAGSPQSVCWCSTLPGIEIIEEGKDCLCPDCLKKEIANKISVFVHEYHLGKQDNIAPKYAIINAPLIDGIDYYIKNGLWVFTEWYHLKRGHCCDSGCRHCPYK